MRTAAGSSPVRIEAIREVLLADTEALAPAAQAVFGETPPDVICALRPKPRRLYLANADEAKRHSGPAGIRQFASAKPEFSILPPGRFAAAQARDGAAPAAAPWLLELSSAAAYSATLAALEALKVRPARSLSAVFQDVAALVSAVTAPTWLLEIGEHSSQALLVSRDGVLAVGDISLNLDRIAEAVQAELNLKFRGSAARLFFNPDYDFNEAGPRVAARLAAVIKPELAALQGAHGAPTSLFGAGLPGAQQWFTTELATALGLTVFSPGLTSLGVAPELPEPDTALSPAWFGLLRLIGAEAKGAGSNWTTEWLGFESPAGAASAKPAAAVVPAAPVAAAAVVPAPAAAKPQPTKSAAAPAPAPAPAAKSAPTAPKPDKTATPAPAPAPKAVEPKVVKPAPVVPVEVPVEKVPEFSLEPPPPRPLNRKAIGIVALLVVLIGGGIGYYAYEQKQEAARMAEQRALVERKLQAEVAKAKLAELQARMEADARRRAQEESAHKLAETEAARERAEAEARNQAAARLANARGGLIITSDPAGAMVTVGNLPPQRTPATFLDVRLGHYSVKIALLNHETANLDLEVKEDAVTESGVIKLQRLVGTLDLATAPIVANYEIRPAGALIVAPDAQRRGMTPAVLSDLPPGDYVVNLTSNGWSPHSENFTITRDETTRLQWTFPKGTVSIVSSPAGAAVTRDGVAVGITPLTLSDQEPGPAQYVLALDGYAAEAVSGQIVGGQTLELTPPLERMDHVSRMNEVDQKPVLISAVQPKVSYELRQSQRTGHVDIELTVTRTGATADAIIKPGSDRELAPFCLAAALQWKFKPASIKGKPVNVRLIVPFDIGPST